MISGLKIKNIRDDISSGESSKEKGETGEASMLILRLAGFEIIKDQGNFRDRADGDSIDSKEESAGEVLVLKIVMGVRARNEADNTKATETRMWVKDKAK